MTNKWVYGLALALVIGSTAALAAPKDDDWAPPGQRGTGGAGEQAQLQGQAQGQGQLQGQTANAGAVGIGVGEGGSATAGAIGLGGKQAQGQSSENVNRNVAKGGAGGTASSGAYSGSSSRVGDTSSFSEGSDARSASGAISGGNETAQDVSLDASDNSVQNLTYAGDKFPVSTAASLFTQVCQQGVSGQGDDWGASAVFSDPLCDEIRVAQFYWIAHINEHSHGNDEQAAEFKTMYVAQMADIQKMMDATDELGIVDRISGFLLKPLGVVALLVFLL